MISWPSDADGDALRAMESGGFDFSKPSVIEFYVEFESWPPPGKAIAELARKYPDFTINEPEDDFVGDITIRLRDLITYEFLKRVQREVTELMVPFTGECDSWLVGHEPTRH